jgi:hypothetical protein
VNDLIAKIRKWLGMDKPKAPADEDLARAEDEGMSPPDVETPSPQAPPPGS